MPKSTTNSNNNDESDNDFSSANENSNLSEINPLILSSQANLRTSSSSIQIPSTFNQNSSSSTASFTTNNNLNINSSVNINNNNNNSNNSSNNSNKKFRHQNFSKNIYIGTKNAEKWDNLRNLFQFKNDVEFVSFLLKSAENEAKSNKNGFKLPIFQKDNTDNSEDYDKEQSSSSLYLHKKQKKMELQQPITPPLPQQQASLQQQQEQPQIQPQQQLQQPTIQQQQPTIQQQQQMNVQKKIKRVQFQDNVNIINSDNLSQQHELNLSKSAGTTNDNNAQDHSISSTIDGSVSSEESNNTTEILDCRIEEKIKNEMEEKQKLIESGRNSTNVSGRYDDAPTPPPNITSSLIDKDNEDSDDEEEEEESDVLRPQLIHKRRFYDIRKAPTILEVKMNDGMPGSNQDKSVFDFKDDDDDDDCEEGRLEINSEFMIRDRKNKKPYKSKICLACNTKHGKEICPIRNPIGSIINPIDYSEWVKEHPEPPPPPLPPIDNVIDDDKLFMDESMKSENEAEDDQDDGEDLTDDFNDEDLDDKQPIIMQDDCNEITFSQISLPNEFEFLPSNVNPMAKMSVFTKIPIPKYTQIGPLIGELIREVDIPDDCNMSYIFEIHDSVVSKSIYYNMENKNKSNWIRYLQPARARDQRNLTMIKVEDKIYFVSCMDINIGCELLYWSDEVNSAWGKKKIEKTNCGGCNLKFEHAIHYRTHCSVFHDPGFSLTIRKYHCKICGMAVLGKENIMKHAEKLHDGKGAYQCQFCKKFFLRLNYLEMHRTYGCSANPQRARPLCDFCGRKFCQPQKLKVHIKRMHSDMAEVLRDFQCKLCSKLLGSRAALQRHSKEVHSRNSAVVSCPRCQKLFQNRSNLKIHMLTHSGVRPFKCSENECTAAFTTKQCLQFHYKKVHGYTQEQMPKIERSVAYTFDAYSGGLKHEDLEGMTRRQRKQLGDSLNKVTKSMPKREKEMILKDKNFLSSITDLCKNESNLNLLSSKISSILNCNLKEMNKKLMGQSEMGDTQDNCPEFDANSAYSEHANISEMESKMLNSKGLSMMHHKHNEDNPDNMLNHSNVSANDTNTQDMDDEEDEDSDHNSFKMGSKRLMENQQMGLPTNPRLKDFLMQTNPNLVISKGSKKWISESSNHMTDMEEPEANLMAVANRDFLAKLINSKFQQKNHNNNRSIDNEDDDDNSTILDVVDSNIHHQQQQQHQQQQHNQENGQFNTPFANSNSNNNNDMMDIQAQYANNVNNNTFNPHFTPLGGFYNSNSTINRGMASSIPTSASLLVEAALNSVSNIIGGADMESNENQQISINNNENQQNELPDEMTNSEYSSTHNIMDAVDENMKIMKSQNFPLHLPSMPQFSSNNNNNIINENNEIDVDAAPTPKSQEKLCSYAASNNTEKEINSFSNQQNDSCSPSREMTPDQHSNYNTNFNNPRAQIQNSPSQIPNRQMYTEHDLISPASTPSLPRYDFGAENYRRREKNLQAASGIENYNKNMHHHQQQQQQQQQQHLTQLSSDEENSIVIAENLSINHQNSHVPSDKIKLNSQIDLLYANNKYDTSTPNASNQLHRESLNDLRLKYNDQGIDIQEFRNSVVSDNVSGSASTSGGGVVSDYQGLDMSSRGSIGYHPHNFQISSSSSSNISFNRYQHHIYDILTDREQQSQQQQHQQPNQNQQDHHSFQSMQQQQQIQNLLQDHISQDQDADQIPSGVDLSRTSNYIVPPSPPTPHLPYAVHTPSEMLRMVSLDLSSGGSGASASMVGSNNSHHVRHHASFLPHGPNRDLSDHHRFLSATDQRLLVDPTAHLLLEQNNRLLSSENNRILDQTRLLSETSTNRHVVSPRGFGAYHHPHSHHSHQVSSNYHHHTTVKQTLGSPSNQHSSANYHPFSATYY